MRCFLSYYRSGMGKMRIQKLQVKTGKRKCAILIGSGVSKKIGISLKQHGFTVQKNKLFILSDQSLKGQRSELISQLKRQGWSVHELSVKAGESLKTLSSLNRIYHFLVKNKADRNSIVLALGGGTIGDVAGFVASTYMRGIAWVGVPTTLLAQVDSSVGGKTGINLGDGKNLVGSFYQPQLVICDTNYLSTLHHREVVSGFGEVIKYALTYDSLLFDYCKKNLEQILGLDQKVLPFLVKRSLQWKVQAVEKDELDLHGVREVLNFGHTFGHALEAIFSYKRYKHGEAVLWGIRFALALSVIKKDLSEEDFMRINSLLMELRIPALPQKLNFQKMIKLMHKDKKAQRGVIHFVLLKKLGRPVTRVKVTEKDLNAAFELIMRKGYGRK